MRVNKVLTSHLCIAVTSLFVPSRQFRVNLPTIFNHRNHLLEISSNFQLSIIRERRGSRSDSFNDKDINIRNETLSGNYFLDNIAKNEDSKSAVESGHVYYVATPLGNLKDITFRAIEVLSSVDIICAEDTRHTISLLRHLNLPHKDILSHHEHNWRMQIPKIISMIERGMSIAVVSDAGTPGISDPGAELASALADKGNGVKAKL